MHPEAIKRVWAGGEDYFFLGIGELRAVEKQCGGAGYNVITLHLLGQQCSVDEVLAPIRLGLIGGGMKEREADAALARALTAKRVNHLMPLAAELMHEFTMGSGADDPGEFSAGEETIQTRQNPSQTDKPDGADTSQPGQ